ncbi:MAG TPA: hypothetical protein DC049_14080 [Spirochaetia bacterium]|nr:hypothetical protein [Spirochaetia bacterium]
MSKKIIINFVRLFLFLTCCNFKLMNLLCVDFYLSPAGSDKNPGSLEKPWQTMQYAVENLNAGSTLYVRQGIYQGDIVIKKSGAANAYINLENYIGEKPVIDGKFRNEYGFQIHSSYIRIRGFEIKNIKGNPESGNDNYKHTAGIAIYKPASHCIVENNTIHNVIGSEKRTPLGILILSSTGRGFQIINNTVFGINFGESYGIRAWAPETIIKKNLVFLCDKEGIRITTQSNINGTMYENIVEENIIIHNRVGISVNMCWNSIPVIIRNNFSAWNWHLGLQSKHVTNVLFEHNIFLENMHFGIDLHGSSRQGDMWQVFGNTIKNNIFCKNVTDLFIFDKEIFGEKIDYNYYEKQNYGWIGYFDYTGWFENDNPASGRYKNLTELRKASFGKETINGPYEIHGLEGEILFTDPKKFNFSLQDVSAAKKKADDGLDMGILGSKLIEVGAKKKYSLAMIPDINELGLTAENISAKNEKNNITHVLDNSDETYWEITEKDNDLREIILILPTAYTGELRYLVITRYYGDKKYYFKDFELWRLSDKNSWVIVPEPPEHAFLGVTVKDYNGECWKLPDGVKTRKLKIIFNEGNSEITRIPTIKIYGEAEVQ